MVMLYNLFQGRGSESGGEGAAVTLALNEVFQFKHDSVAYFGS